MTKTALEWLIKHQETSLIPRRNAPKLGTQTHPNVGLEFQYREVLSQLVERMHRSTLYWIGAAWRSNPPTLSSDEAPAITLTRSIRKLVRQWTREFNEISERTARQFVEQNTKLTSQQIIASMNKLGATVEFKMTPAIRDVAQASIAENVSLIKSIPQHYFRELEGLVMRSVQNGRDLESLTEALQERYKITENRAALIARDQNNKAHAAISRAKQLDLGITEGVWIHSSAGKTPRPTHVKMNGKTFDLKRGMWDSAVGRYVLPGEEVNCRCQWRPVIPGFS